MDHQEQPKNMTLTVKGVDGRSILFRTNQITPLRKLMISYCDWEQQVVDDVRFMYDGRPVHRDNTPEQLRMKHGDVIHALVGRTDDQGEPENIQIFVKGLDGRIALFRIDQTTPLRKLMQLYCDREQLVLENLRFLYGSRQISDLDETPQQLGMTEGTVIHVILRLLGS